MMSPDILLEHGIKQIHVVRLGLDGVGEEAEGLVGQESINGDLGPGTGC